MDVDNYNRYSVVDNRIKLEKQNKRNDQVTELILDNCRAKQLRGITDEFVNLKFLSAIDIGLVTLEGFPRLPNLDRLDLCDNKLKGGLGFLRGCPRLQHLNISGNPIADIEAVEPLKAFNHLVNLDIYNCDITKSNDYRQRVFNLLPNLKTLDGFHRSDLESNDSEASEDDRMSLDNNNPVTSESLPQPTNIAEVCQVLKPIQEPVSKQENVEEAQVGHHDEKSVEQIPPSSEEKQIESKESSDTKDVESVAEKKLGAADDAIQAEIAKQDEESQAEIADQSGENQAEVVLDNESQEQVPVQSGENLAEATIQSSESQENPSVQPDEVESSQEEESESCEEYDPVEIVYDDEQIVSDVSENEENGRNYHDGDEDDDDEEYTDEDVDDEGAEYSESEHEVEMIGGQDCSVDNEASAESIEHQEVQSEENRGDEEGEELEEGEVVDEDDEEPDEKQSTCGSQEETVNLQPLQQVETELESSVIELSVTSNDMTLVSQTSVDDSPEQKGHKRTYEEAGDGADNQ